DRAQGSPLDRAQGAKNKGNKYFKAGKYEQAIQCYTDAIGLCPTENQTDLSTFYQNRAACIQMCPCVNINNTGLYCTQG
uniref:Uncharacterized protein n=1 Tax=Hucho hucho TaxID=62062 RepID=A0A4W5K8D6_9TELE